MGNVASWTAGVSKPGGHDASGEASLRSNAQLLLATPQPTLNLRNLKQLEYCNLSEYNSNQSVSQYLISQNAKAAA